MVYSLAHFKAIDFESRKGIAAVFVYLLRHDTAAITAYMEHHAALLYQMMDGCGGWGGSGLSQRSADSHSRRLIPRSYSFPDLALHCGTMVRECIKIPSLHAALLEGPDGGLSKQMRELMATYVNDPNFEVRGGRVGEGAKGRMSCASTTPTLRCGHGRHEGVYEHCTAPRPSPVPSDSRCLPTHSTHSQRF